MVDLWQRCDTLCISGFVDAARSAPHVDTFTPDGCVAKRAAWAVAQSNRGGSKKGQGAQPPLYCPSPMKYLVSVTA